MIVSFLLESVCFSMPLLRLIYLPTCIIMNELHHLNVIFLCLVLFPAWERGGGGEGENKINDMYELLVGLPKLQFSLNYFWAIIQSI